MGQGREMTPAIKSISHLINEALEMRFDKFLYCLNSADGLLTGQLGAPLLVVSHGMAAEHIQGWERQTFTEDPLRRMAASGALPMNWNLPLVWENVKGRIDLPHVHLSAPEVDMLRRSFDAGVRTGFNVPVQMAQNLFALISFYSSLPRSEVLPTRACVERLFFIAHQVQTEFAARFADRAVRRPGTKPRLSPREIECLGWVVKGKNATEIADILVLSRETVRDHLKRVSAKLDASTRAQAIARAYALGYLQ